jgi:hypothetical protein
VKSRRKQLVLLIGLVSAVLVLIGLVVYFEPFATRYEGKTVNGWIDELGDTYHRFKVSGATISPNDDVVAYFGAKAVKTLILPSKPPFWHSFLLKIDIPDLQQYLQDKKALNDLKEGIKRGWLINYCETNPNFEANSLSTQSDEFLLALFTRTSLRHRENRLTRYIDHPDEIIRTRAAKLLKQFQKTQP